MSDESPFEALGLDPSMSPEQLTEELRRRVELASDAEKMRLQRAWRELTLKDETRVRLALLTHPRVPAGHDPIDTLREAVPPFISRREAPAIEATVSDALIDDFDAASPIEPPNPWSSNS